MGFVGYSM